MLKILILFLLMTCACSGQARHVLEEKYPKCNISLIDREGDTETYEIVCPKKASFVKKIRKTR